MPRTLTILAAAPGDAASDRAVIETVVDHLNSGAARIAGAHLDLVFEPRGMDFRAAAEAVFVALVGTRFDAPGVEGTGARDLYSALLTHADNAGNRGVLIFFNDEAVPPSRIDATQLKQVQDFRRDAEARGFAIHAFASREDLRRLLEAALERIVLSLPVFQRAADDEAPAVTVAAKPSAGLRDSLTPPALAPAANDDDAIGPTDETLENLVATIDRKAWEMIELVATIGEIVVYMVEDLTRRKDAKGHYGEAVEDGDMGIIYSGMVQKQDADLAAFTADAASRAALLREIYRAALNGIRIEIYRRRRADGTNTALALDATPLLPALLRFAGPLASVEPHARALRDRVSGLPRPSAEFHKAKSRAIEFFDAFLSNAAELRTMLERGGAPRA